MKVLTYAWLLLALYIGNVVKVFSLSTDFFYGENALGFCTGHRSDCSSRNLDFVAFVKKSCTTGFEVQCRIKPNEAHRIYLWIGDGPFCQTKQSDCHQLNMEFVLFHSNPFNNVKSACLTGMKALCRSRSDHNPHRVLLGEPKFCQSSIEECHSYDMKPVTENIYSSYKGRCWTGFMTECQVRTKPKLNLKINRANEIGIMVFNVDTEPLYFSHNGQVERTCHIPGVLAAVEKLDVVIFTNAFIDGCLSGMMDMKMLLTINGFYFSTRKAKSSLLKMRLFNSGIFIASRWNITHTQTVVFKTIPGITDRNFKQASGLVYARINKNETIYHVIALHLQDKASCLMNEIRLKQAKEVDQFIKLLDIPKNEPILIGGNFNADKINDERHVTDLFDALHFDTPNQQINNFTATFDPYTNDLVVSESRKWQEFISYRKDYKHPITKNMITIMGNLMAKEEFKFCSDAKGVILTHVSAKNSKCTTVSSTRQLSRFYPVFGEFVF